MRRPTDRWVLAAIGAATYAALWWGAVFVAAFVAFHDLPTSGAVADRIADGISAFFLFAVALMVGLVLAHAAWAGIMATLWPVQVGARFAILLGIVAAATATAPLTLGIFGSQQELGWILLTVAVPLVGTRWASGAKSTVP